MIATGASDGELIVRSYAEADNQSAVVFRDCSVRAAITECKFSSQKSSVLATAYTSGVIAMWDFKNPTQPLRHKFMAHAQACTGLAFSPVNNLLLCSCGAD